MMRRTLALAGAAVLAVGISGLAAPAAADSGAGIASHGVVIEEYSANLDGAGASGNIDGDFVTLVNHGGTSVDVSGFMLSGCDATNPIEPFGTIPPNTTLNSGQTYLFANDDYDRSGGPLRDQAFDSNADLEQIAGGLRLVDSSSVQQDSVKWGTPHATCQVFPEAVDDNGNPVSITDLLSSNRDFTTTPFSWFAASPTP